MRDGPRSPRGRAQENLPLLWLLWASALPALPLVILQALWLRRRIPRLPEASGTATGSSGEGEGSTRLLIVGESTAVGVGASRLSEAIPGFLSRALALRGGGVIEWTLVGKNGATLGRQCDLLAQKASALQEHQWAVVLAGVNDVFGLSSLRRWRRDIRSMTRQLRTAGCTRIVFSSVPPIERFSALRAPLRWVLGLRARLLDVYLRRELKLHDDCVYARVEFPVGAQYLAVDGVHPSSLGYEVWSQQLADVF